MVVVEVSGCRRRRWRSWGRCLGGVESGREENGEWNRNKREFSVCDLFFFLVDQTDTQITLTALSLIFTISYLGNSHRVYVSCCDGTRVSRYFWDFKLYRLIADRLINGNKQWTEEVTLVGTKHLLIFCSCCFFVCRSNKQQQILESCLVVVDQIFRLIQQKFVWIIIDVSAPSSAVCLLECQQRLQVKANMYACMTSDADTGTPD